MSFTIFTTPKPLKGLRLISFINALGTWKRLYPRPEIIVFGDDPILPYLGVRVIDEYKRNDRGLPYIDDLFDRVQELSQSDIIMYTNDDMLFLPDLVVAVSSLANFCGADFLALGQRWDTDVPNLLPFEDNWRNTLYQARQAAVLHHPSGKDYFIFRRPLGFPLLSLFVGRPAWDVLLVDSAVQSGIPLIDLTPAVTAIHANHDYGHVPGGLHPNRTRLEEWKHNREAFLDILPYLPPTHMPNFPWVMDVSGRIRKRPDNGEEEIL